MKFNIEKHEYMNVAELGASLLRASFSGDLKLVRFLLTSPEIKNHADIEYQDREGNNALFHAAVQDHIEIIKYLLTSFELKIHSNIDTLNLKGDSILNYACKHNSLKTIHYLLEDTDFNINLNKENYLGINPIIYAFSNQNIQILKYLLLEKKVKIDDYTYQWIKNTKKVENHLGKTYLVGEDIIKLIENVYFFQHINNIIVGKNIKNNIVKV